MRREFFSLELLQRNVDEAQLPRDFAYFVIQNHPAAPDLWAWYAAPAVTGYLAVAALAVYGFLVSQAGRPLISDKIIEE